jgi:hypothetical protein
LSTTFSNSGQLTTVIGHNLLNTEGAVQITVRNPDGQVSNGLSFGRQVVFTTLQISPADPDDLVAGDAARQTDQVAVHGINSLGGTVDVTQNPLVVLQSSNPNVATISNDPASRGTVTATAAGETEITARIAASGLQAFVQSAPVTYRVADVLSITGIMPGDATVGVASSFTVTAAGGIEPLGWSITGGDVDANGSGTPGTPCEAIDFDLAATDRFLVGQGTPVNPGLCDFVVEAEDSAGQNAQSTIHITVIGDFHVTTIATDQTDLDLSTSFGAPAVPLSIKWGTLLS